MYDKSKEYTSIKDRLIKKFFPDIITFGIKVGVVVSDEEKIENKDKVVFGKCKKADDLLLFYTGYHFVITIYEMNVCNYGFNKEQKELLMYHELKHCGIDEGGKPYIKAHDIEEFNDIIQNYGMNWATDYKGFIGEKINT